MGAVMVDLIDLVNLVRINNLEDARVASAQRADLRERAEFLRDHYGVTVPNFYQFNQENPPRQPDGLFKRLIKNAVIGTVVGGALGALAIGAVALFSGGALTFTMLGLSGLSAVGLAAAGGAAVMGFASIFEDQTPVIQQEQSKRYEQFLNAVETELHNQGVQQARGPGVASALTQPSTRFRDMVNASRETSTQIQRS